MYSVQMYFLSILLKIYIKNTEEKLETFKFESNSRESTAKILVAVV